MIWILLGLLRDTCLLPDSMVIESETDLLPRNVRMDFESSLLEADVALLRTRRPITTTTPKISEDTRKSPSILSLQGLGEALFGTAGSDDEDDDENSSKNGDTTSTTASNSNTTNGGNMPYGEKGEEWEELEIDSLLQHPAMPPSFISSLSALRMNLLSTRWDHGYQHLSSLWSENNQGNDGSFTNEEGIVGSNNLNTQIHSSSVASTPDNKNKSNSSPAVGASMEDLRYIYRLLYCTTYYMFFFNLFLLYSNHPYYLL